MRFLKLTLFCFLISLPLFSQNTAKLSGNISDELLSQYKFGPLHPGSPAGKAVLVEIKNNTVVQEVNFKKDNSFEFIDVPFSNYFIEIRVKDSTIASQFISVNSKFVNRINIKPNKISFADEVLVERNLDANNINLYSAGVNYKVGDIESMPMLSQNKSIENVLLNSPGVVPDEDGRMHVRGEDAQLQYNIDGIPVTANQTRIYSSLFNSGIIKSVDFIRGGFDAEYGVALSGVLNINTKSGFDKPFFAHAYTQGSSFNGNDQGIELGGNLNQDAALFVAYSSNFSGRYLDPISFGDPIHNNGKSQNLFAKTDFLLSDKIDLIVLGSYAKTNFAIPNQDATSKQDQMQAIENSMIGLRLNAELSENTLFSILAYAKSDHAKITTNDLDRISSTQDSVTAMQSDKFFMGGNRHRRTYGTSAEINIKNLFTNNDNFKAGVGGENNPLSEFFTFAVTNPALSNKDSSGGDARYLPYDISKGGKPFLVDRTLESNRVFTFVQDNFNLGEYKIAAGIRYDMFKLFETENNISFRLGVSRKINDDLIVRASYNGIVMQAPLENILVSSSDQARILTGAEQVGISNNVRSQKSHVIEIGALYKINDYLTLDFAGFGKYINDFLVKVELGNSGVIFPVNLKTGMVAGGEVSLRLKNWNNFSGFLNISSCVSLGLIPTDGTSPISAGLILGEEGQNYSHPFKGEDAFPTEHNQLLTANFNLTYNYNYGLAFTLGGRFDMGLPFDLVDKNGIGLDPEQSKLELMRRGYSERVINLLSLESEKPGSPDKSVAPHAIFDFAISFDMRKSLSIPLKLSANVINLLDSDYLYKFESSFGGTHFGMPRMFSLRADLFAM